MIGTNIKSIRHLYRLVSDTSFNILLLRFSDGHYDFCKVIKMPKNSPFGENLFIFNRHSRQSHWSFDSVLTNTYFRQNYNVDEIYTKYSRLITINPSEFSQFKDYFTDMILLPSNFEDKYHSFLKENTKSLKPLTSRYGIIFEEDVRAKKIYLYTEDSKNFFLWAIKNSVENRISFYTIKTILLWNESYKQLTKNLSKGTITAYASRENIKTLLNEMKMLRMEKRINDSINLFNTIQKKLLKTNNLSDENKQALWRFSKLTEAKKNNFIRKMSSVNDFDELTRQLRFVTSVHFSWNKESFIDFIKNVEGINYEKIYENEKIVLVKVLDYETIKQLGKTTNWCISKNKQYWNNYIEHMNGQCTQYMLFDFSKLEDDKLSIIGFTTTRNKGITSAHNFINDNLIGGEEENYGLLKSFIERFKETKNIYNILNADGIDITLIVHYDTPLYKWDKENLMNYLHECVDKENITIIKDSDNKLVLSVQDENIRYFFGNSYQDNIDSEYWDEKHLIFIDFNMSQFDTNKVQYAILASNYSYEDVCVGLFDETSRMLNTSLDLKLIEFDLPYDTIRRVDNKLVKLKNALFSYNVPLIEDSLKDKQGQNLLKEIINNEIGQDSMYDLIKKTIISYMSFDYLDIIYDNGLKLSSLIPEGYVGDILRNAFYKIENSGLHSTRYTTMPSITDTDIEDFYNGTLPSKNDTLYVGCYLAIKKIVENEVNLTNKQYNSMYGSFLNDVSLRFNGQICEDLALMLIDKIDFSDANTNALYIIKIAVKNPSGKLFSIVEKLANKTDKCKRALEKEMANTKKSFSTFTVTFDNNYILDYHNVHANNLEVVLEDVNNGRLF